MNLSDKMDQEEVNAETVKLREDLYAAVDQVIADFFDTNRVPLERLFLAFTMTVFGERNLPAERMVPLMLWKTKSGQTVGNAASDGHAFGRYLRASLKDTDTALYLAIAGGLLGNASESPSDAPRKAEEGNPQG